MMGEAEQEGWEVVARASGMTQAEIITGRLESEGIRTQRRYEAAGTIYAITVDGLGEVRILVPAEDWPRAHEILQRAYDDGELPWDQES